MLSAILKKQFAGESHLPPYNYHVTESIVSLEDGRLAFTVRTTGVPFEVTSDGMLDNQYNSLNDLFLSIAKSTGSRLAAWLHIDHYQTEFSTNYDFEFQWLREFSDKYAKKFKGADVFETAFYLTFVLKPGVNDNQDEALGEFRKLQTIIYQALISYGAEILTTYEFQGHLFSQFYEFISYLYNGTWEKVPVTALPLREAVPTNYIHHGYQFMETRFREGGSQFSAYLDLKDFPEPTTRGKFNPLLKLSFPFVMCLSFTFIDVTKAIRLIDQAANKMESAGDRATTQLDDLASGQSALAAGEIYFGEFHGAMAVHGATEKQVEDRTALALSTLSSYCATQFVAATISAPQTFYSMFPGNTKRRPRPMPKTTRNLLGLFSMNNYSSGKQHGNPVGDGTAVVPLQTTVNGVYHFNFHYSIMDMDVLGEKRAGHTLILGATGAGKTTLQTALLAFLSRWNNKLFAIDKDESMRGFIEALGGTYFQLSSGVPTGLNPFQLPDTPQNRSFLYDLVAACGRKGTNDATAEDTKDIKQAVDNVMQMEFPQRRFAILLQSIPDRGEDCLKRRLAAWCHGEVEGRYAYALDNPTNNFDWKEFKRVGFDVSDFLVSDHPATEPILSYLFHLKTLMQQGGGLLATVVEEFWVPLQYPTTAAEILDSLKTGRRRDEFIVLVSQSPEDAIMSPLLPAILQQTPTKIYLPNPEAEYETKDGGGYSRFLSQKEFLQLQALGLQSRKFLVKQGQQSCIAKLDLSEMSEYIAVLAMAEDEFKYLEEAKSSVGSHPDAWVPFYIQAAVARARIKKHARIA